MKIIETGKIRRSHPEPRQKPSLAAIIVPGNALCISDFILASPRVLAGNERYAKVNKYALGYLPDRDVFNYRIGRNTKPARKN